MKRTTKGTKDTMTTDTNAFPLWSLCPLWFSSSVLQTLNLHAPCADFCVAFCSRVKVLDWCATYTEIAKARKNENAKPLRPRDRINKMDRMRRQAKRSSFACLVTFLSILLSCPRFLVFVLRDAVERGCAMLEFLSPRAVGKNVQFGSGSAGLGFFRTTNVDCNRY